MVIWDVAAATPLPGRDSCTPLPGRDPPERDVAAPLPGREEAAIRVRVRKLGLEHMPVMHAPLPLCPMGRHTSVNDTHLKVRRAAMVTVMVRIKVGVKVTIRIQGWVMAGSCMQ